MASMIELDLGEDVKKVLELFEKYKDLVVGTSGKDIANKYLDDASDKLKAEIDLVIKTVEDKVQGLIEEGVDNIYAALGLDETVISFARTMIKTAEMAANLASSYLLKGMMMLNSIDVNNIPYSIGAAAMLIIRSLADMWYQAFMKAYGIYVDMIINFIIDPGAALEALKNYIIETAIKMAEDIIDEQMRKYLGITLAQAKFYCRKGYGLYKQYKKKKKEERDAKAAKKDEDLMESVANISGSGSKKSVSVSVSVNSETLKKQLLAWLKSQRDSLYSAFCILQIKDAINDIKAAVKQMTDVSLESLAENINSLDDVITMLDEMGLGDDSTAVDLSLIPSLGINDMIASLQSLTDTQTLMNEGKLLAGGVAGSVMTSSTLNANLTSTLTFDISTDTDKRIITVKIYTDPTKSSVSNKIYKVFSNAKNTDKTKVFTPSECKVVQDAILKLYSETHKGTKSVSLTKYTVNIELAIEDKVETSKNKKENKGTDVDSSKTEQVNKKSSNAKTVELAVVEDEVKTKAQQEKDSKETRRNTISILHTVFSLVKSVFPPIKELAKLIQNYKENKAYVRGKHYDSLVTLFLDALKKLGIGESKKFDASGGQTASSAMYTVRTYPLYNFLKDKNIVKSGEVTKDITPSEAMRINEWLSINDTTATKVNESSNTMLYIDYDAIEDYLNCLQQQKQEALSVIEDANLAESFVSCESKYRNGTFDGLEKVEVCEDRIFYSSSRLPRYPSLIISCKSKGYNIDY